MNPIPNVNTSTKSKDLMQNTSPRNSGNDANGRGWGDHLVCVIITHCVRKSICDSPLRQAEIQIGGSSLECMFYLTALKSSFLNKIFVLLY